MMTGEPVRVPFSEIDLEDETFRYRVNLRVGNLAKSIKRDGQQIPVVLRKRPRRRHQIVSGFRRIAALSGLGSHTVLAHIRRDLETDEKACRASIIENEHRKTFSDLDRARAALAYRQHGKTNRQIEELLGVGKRQRQRLQGLLSFPPPLREAMESQTLSTTLAVRLMQFIRKLPEQDQNAAAIQWIDWIRARRA